MFAVKLRAVRFGGLGLSRLPRGNSELLPHRLSEVTDLIRVSARPSVQFRQPRLECSGDRLGDPLSREFTDPRKEFVSLLAFDAEGHVVNSRKI